MTVNAAECLLQIEGLQKSYAAPVLCDVRLELRTGEVHALVGANGAGKSTLARIVSGLTHPDGGRMTLAGFPYAPKNKNAAESRGVYLVMQELNLITTLTVAENLFLNRLPRRFGFVSFARLHASAVRALDTVGLAEINPRTPVHQLGVGQQQLVEIAAALCRQCRLLILDEPTAALTDPQIDLLFEHIRRLKDNGVGIIYISHRMDEIRRIADRVTVLRDGHVINTQPAAATSISQIVKQMVGREVVEQIDLGKRAIGQVALRVERLCRGNRVKDVSFTVRRGEILGFAGLVGSGRTETLRAIYGADQPDEGEVYVNNQQVAVGIRRPADAVRAGIGMIPEDRKQHGLLLPQALRVNTSLANLKRFSKFKGWIDRAREYQTCAAVCNRLEVRCESLEQTAAELSGGNQQKVVFSRWMLKDCAVLLLDEPTRGIDVGAKWTIYQVLGELARKGKALVVVSSELTELMSICDRIAVMSAGRLVRIFTREEWSEDRIMTAAFSGHFDPGGSKGGMRRG